MTIQSSDWRGCCSLLNNISPLANDWLLGENRRIAMTNNEILFNAVFVTIVPYLLEIWLIGWLCKRKKWIKGATIAIIVSLVFKFLSQWSIHILTPVSILVGIVGAILCAAVALSWFTRQSRKS
jgi:uncharacterized BrkB/YihY/UPF0761 family membrane protein